jgi:hypothetical protein
LAVISCPLPTTPSFVRLRLILSSSSNTPISTR